MQAVSTTPGLFRIQLNQYWDATQVGTGNRDPTVTILIYRKQNPILVESITIPLREELPLAFDNAACARLRNLNFSQARYYQDVQLDPARYNDPGGYYMVWERCCRNDALTNAVSVGNAGVAMTFYAEFPAITRNGQNFRNSLPDFRLPNGDYICIGKSFTFDVGATDADGDQLRYSLVTPLNGYTNRNTPISTNDSPRSSYPTVTWASGISLANVIPGNPPLTIDPTTGTVSVRATREGLYLFTVLCEEYRNGVKIGSVRRDMQLPVVDCSRNTPPSPVVSLNSQPLAATDIVWCATQPLVLSVERNPNWAYQWQKDGDNLRGDTTSTFTVKESGTYTVVRSLARACANDTVSKAYKVTFVTAPPVSLTTSRGQPYCTGDTLLLVAEGQPGYQYRWQRDTTLLAGQQQSTLRITQSGQYIVLAKPAAAVCEGADTLTVTMNPRPTASASASTSALCPGDSITLTAQTGTGYRYRWQQGTSRLADSTSRIAVRQAGTYRVTVTGANGCTATSGAVTVNALTAPTVVFDSIPPQCSISNPPVSLRGSPTGGTYAGAGVANGTFAPATAGVGRHTITYTVTGSNGCKTSQTRMAMVDAGPSITGPAVYQIVKGSSVQLKTQSNTPIARYQWEPPASLSRADVAAPTASPAETTPYTLTALSENGCPVTFAVRVEVVEPLYIPSAFSPNADGINDTWIIPNIEAFPACEVAIFNRWGEVIYESVGYAQPWDGTYRKQPVTAGAYTYRIRAGAGLFTTVYRGQVIVLK
ncbi:hypothetical protein AWR27_02725 [Spirosoma montaniterrae]|uniref:Ig-like domain-containing protein n=2 Tax=Spirosoma montaniterrae TaxID=1178516 RepID=A0A1P9X3X0_9BACT|nr:hypothetical protein AWR27_02725 [Spirosoma montaniterrae]